MPKTEIFFICECGFPENDHHFKHVYKKSCSVLKTTEKKENNPIERFSFSMNNFSSHLRVKCGFQDCSSSKEFHLPVYLKHNFYPITETYRKANFAVPLNSTCLKCFLSLEKHSEQNHGFYIDVEVTERKKEDVLEFIHPDYENITFVNQHSKDFSASN